MAKALGRIMIIEVPTITILMQLLKPLNLELFLQEKAITFQHIQDLEIYTPKSFLAKNPSSSLARFTKTKYLNLVHAKIKCSFFGNLNQRKLVTFGGFPDIAFLIAFAEMSRRFWLLHCLGFWFLHFFHH
ncbi:hypothetical protein Goari_004515 [Gossypium aridum]|uniref:Uncharacterized protein n=1 Tax=Gossypium aridum TaxID=34290 RepID=A0A7J8Y3R4_GOSAI|nr:hypothetical protein [Gossypium aridum]